MKLRRYGADCGLGRAANRSIWRAAALAKAASSGPSVAECRQVCRNVTTYRIAFGRGVYPFCPCDAADGSFAGRYRARALRGPLMEASRQFHQSAACERASSVVISVTISGRSRKMIRSVPAKSSWCSCLRDPSSLYFACVQKVQQLGDPDHHRRCLFPTSGACMASRKAAIAALSHLC